jgi:ankyrin repeat protein
VLRDGWSALHISAKKNHTDMAQLLLQYAFYLDISALQDIDYVSLAIMAFGFSVSSLATVALAPALASRLRPGATDWGRYYDTSPTLVSGDIAAGMAFLEARDVAAPMRGVGT